MIGLAAPYRGLQPRVLWLSAHHGPSKWHEGVDPKQLMMRGVQEQHGMVPVTPRIQPRRLARLRRRVVKAWKALDSKTEVSFMPPTCLYH